MLGCAEGGRREHSRHRACSSLSVSGRATARGRAASGVPPGIAKTFLFEIHRYNAERRNLLRSLGLGGGNLAAKTLIPGGISAALVALLATPARADKALDVQIVQTHRKAFQAQTTTLGGTVQTNPNPKFVPVVEQAKPNLKTPLDVVNLAVTLEDVATQTYLQNTMLLDDTRTRALMGSVMGVETQHAATLRAVKALLEANMPELIEISIGADVAKLPAAAGSVAFPEAFEPVTTIAEPETGAVK